MTTKTLFLDIETAPEVAYIWRRFKETVSQTQVKEPGYVLCISWAWNNESPETLSIYKNRSWKRGNRKDDYSIIKKIHSLLNQADIIVGHNIRSFDVGTLNNRFLFHGLPPPSPYKICDTLEILKKNFRLPSNSLESASHYFNIDIKEKQPFSLWRGCLEGDEESWNILTTYCENDVHVVRQLYKKLIPWSHNHPNMSLYDENNIPSCTKCGSYNIQRRGYALTMVNKFQRYYCKDCGGWSRSRYSEKGNKNKLTHAKMN